MPSHRRGPAGDLDQRGQAPVARKRAIGRQLVGAGEFGRSASDGKPAILLDHVHLRGDLRGRAVDLLDPAGAAGRLDHAREHGIVAAHPDRAVAGLVDRLEDRRPLRGPGRRRVSTADGRASRGPEAIRPRSRHDARARTRLARAAFSRILPSRTLASTRSSSVQPALRASQSRRPPGSSATTMPSEATTTN